MRNVLLKRKREKGNTLVLLRINILVLVTNDQQLLDTRVSSDRGH
jgi:hypothetical protein